MEVKAFTVSAAEAKARTIYGIKRREENLAREKKIELAKIQSEILTAADKGDAEVKVLVNHHSFEELRAVLVLNGFSVTSVTSTNSHIKISWRI